MANFPNDTLLNTGATAMAGVATHASIHTAAPNDSGSNESSAARKAITWGTAANGDIAATATLAFTGGAASGPATYVGLWSAASGGTFYGSRALTGDQTFNAAGEYNVTALAMNGAAA